MSCTVLDDLQLVEGRVGKAYKQGVGVVERKYNKCMDEGFGGQRERQWRSRVTLQMWGKAERFMSREDEHRVKYEESMMLRLNAMKKDSLTHFGNIRALTGQMGQGSSLWSPVAQWLEHSLCKRET
uniref:Uncharacterized protein n=1 Tax=Callorhinchus milii TaxID=7868 RepID=A0A4W3HVU0_CALMI